MSIEKKAYIIKVDGTIVPIDHRPTLEEAQKAVGGYVEQLTSRLCRTPNLVVYGDEDGKVVGKPINLRASLLLSWEVVGDILVLEGGWKTFATGK